jgi:AmpD protein
MGEYINNNGELYFAPNWLEYLGLSAHALIVPNGDVMICRTDHQRAYHARGFNTDSLGIEFLVSGEHNYATFLETIKTDWVTTAQYEAGAELVRKWVNDHNIANIKRHSDISPGRKVDPGTGFKWPAFLNLVKNRDL